MSRASSFVSSHAMPLAFVATLALGAPSLSAEPRFAVPTIIDPGENAAGSAVVEMDGHSGPDLVTLDPGDGVLSIALNHGDGTFEVAQRITVIPGSFFAMVDLDHDGLADLVVSEAARLATVRNLGGLQFDQPVFTNNNVGSPFQLADVNGDGQPDAIGADYSTQTMRVALGRSDGTFAPTLSFVCGLSPEGFTCSDFNADGKADVAAWEGSQVVAVLLGQPDGSFSAPFLTALGSVYVASLCAADFDRDGNADIAVNLRYPAGITVLNGRGDGTFEVGAFVPNPSPVAQQTAIAALDQDGDGRPDIVLEQADDHSGASFVTILRNQSGGFVRDQAYVVGPNSRVGLQPNFNPLIPADLDGDGRVDLIAGGGPFEELGEAWASYCLLHNDGGDLFNGLTTFGTGYTSFSTPFLGDFVAARKNPHAMADLYVSGAGEVRRYLNLGRAIFVPAEIVGRGEARRALDLNHDGVDDLVAQSGDSCLVALGAGDGRFGSSTAYAGGTLIALADYDADGDADLWTMNDAGDLQVRKNDGLGAFGGPDVVANYGGYGNILNAADLNGDGRADIIRCVLDEDTYPDYTIRVFDRLARADGTYEPERESSLVPGGHYIGPVGFVGVGDFNGDGHPDVVAAVTGPFGQKWILLCLGDGAGNLALCPIVYSGAEIRSFAIGRLDPARGDALVQVDGDEPAVNSVRVFEWDAAAGSLVQRDRFHPYEASQGSLIADLTGDGLLDIAVLSAHEGYVTLIRQLGPSSDPTPAALSLVSAVLDGSRAHLRWWTGGIAGAARVERRAEDTDWSLVSTPVPDGSELLDYWDASLRPGDRRAWRLGLLENGSWTYSEPAWLTIPDVGRLSIERVTPNPAEAAPTLRFMLRRNGPAKISVFDVGGREVWSPAVRTFAAGSQTLALSPASSLRPGIYLVSVEQSGERAVARFAIVR